MPGRALGALVGPVSAARTMARNNALLLAQLADVPDERRGAHFMCAVAFCHPGGEELASGTMPGRVIRETRGSGGFGYDVLFVADDRPGLTTAELTRRRQGRDLPPGLGAAADGADRRVGSSAADGFGRSGTTVRG